MEATETCRKYSMETIQPALTDALIYYRVGNLSCYCVYYTTAYVHDSRIAN